MWEMLRVGGGEMTARQERLALTREKAGDVEEIK